MKKKGTYLQRRIKNSARIIMILIVVIIFRYGWLQLIQGKALSEMLFYQVERKLQVKFVRGSITDRKGNVLATSVMTKSLFIDPNHVKNPTTLAEDISPFINMSEDEILEIISEGGGFSWLKRNLESSEYESLSKLINEKGYTDCLGFEDEAKRYYPNGILAANVLGFVGTDDKGLAGAEQAFDEYTKGDMTTLSQFTDLRSYPILNSIFSNYDYDGGKCKSIQLTIDNTIQFIVEEELDRAVYATSPVAMTCIVMDPSNGEILAMADRPSYNPNYYEEYDSEYWKNFAISYIYEPGSTFKAIVAGALLQEGIVTPNQYFSDPGYVVFSDRKIQNWSGESFGLVTFSDIVKQSINTGFAIFGYELGADKLIEYTKDFGFGDVTGIELPGEEIGILYEPEKMVDSDIATMSIGQSIAVTPLQLVTAFSAIANDGVLVKPHIVKSIKNFDGSIYLETPIKEVRHVLNYIIDRTLVELLEQVVESGGGNQAAVEGYRIAGKTGTAQKVNSQGLGYADGKYIASFCGFGPVEEPRVALLVVIDEPYGEFYGGQIAAPVASRIFSRIFRYLKIEPSEFDY